MGRNVIWRPLVALAALVLLANAAAQAAAPPPGSYRDSCANIRASGNVLRARCERNSGRTVRAQLNAYSTCVGDISNHDSRLICLRRNEVPAGSWSKDCINPRLVAPGVFAADCRSPRGGRVASRIALNQCPNGLAANRSQLVCEQPRGDIVLYEHVNHRGRAFATSSDIPYLPRRFNDVASSVRVARGIWQVCADANYRGRCIVLRSDVANLIPLGLNDRISSLRRLRDEGGAYPGDQDEDNAPPGSYQQSCRNIQFDGRRLRAQCRDTDRNWQSTELDTRDCDRNEEIVNDDGDLACRLRGGEDQEGQEPPQGSYERSCRDIEFDGRYLTAECRDEHGKWRNARLDVRDCDRDEEIVNDDGELACRMRGPGGYKPGPFPPPGGGNPPPINPDSVNPGAIPPLGDATPGNTPTGVPGAGPAGGPPPGPAVQDGGGNPSTSGPAGAGAPGGNTPVGGPPGAGPSGITLYENPNFEGRSKTFTADIGDLGPVGWNDLVSSLKIARGRWEVCEDANFAGHCETFSGDQASLPPELNDKISSLRRVRRDQQGGQPNE